MVVKNTIIRLRCHPALDAGSRAAMVILQYWTVKHHPYITRSRIKCGMTSFWVVILIIITLTLVSCGPIIRKTNGLFTKLNQSQLIRQGKYGQLDEREENWARVAWRYFENNYNEKTGLVNAIDKVQVTSMWNIADYLSALIIAHRFELIDDKQFDERFSEILNFLNTMELFFNRVPNKMYHTASGTMINYEHQAEEIGWSALDIGRLLIWLYIATREYPEYGEYIEKAVLRWNFCDLLDEDGGLQGGTKIWDTRYHRANVKLFQEGRLGYEEYAAQGFRLWGFDTKKSSLFKPAAKQLIYDIDILVDSRDPRTSETVSPILSAPYLLQGIEFNWDMPNSNSKFDSIHTDKNMAELADRLYRVQEARYSHHRILTARSDYQRSKAPHFVYDTVFANGYAWNTISDSGKYHPDLALVSTRAVFGMWVLWNTAYTDMLMKIAEHMYDPARGFWEGRYEKTGYFEKTITSATNSLVLEALWYKYNGKLYDYKPDYTYITAFLDEWTNHEGKCFPIEQRLEKAVKKRSFNNVKN